MPEKLPGKSKLKKALEVAGIAAGLTVGAEQMAEQLNFHAKPLTEQKSDDNPQHPIEGANYLDLRARRKSQGK